MGHLRIFFREHRRLAILVAALALAIKAVVPAGYMIAQRSQNLTVLICSGTVDVVTAKSLDIPADGKTDGSAGEHGKVNDACPYAALSMASLGGADTPLLALALLFILALGFMPIHLPRLKTQSRLRPPLRGPPFLACPELR